MALLLKYDLPTLALVLAIVAVIALFTHALLNLTKHPLSCFPGPRLWASSRVPYAFSLQNGVLPMKLKALHDIYGPVVRVAPNELSFITAEAWKDIYSDKARRFGRSDIFYGIMGKDAMIGSSNEDHARMRGVLSPAFRVNAMSDCEGNMRRYVHLLLERLGVMEKNNASNGGSDMGGGQDEVTVDIVRWLNFTTFDIVGNFVYGGEPFGCLRRGEFHPWVEMIFSWLESAVVFYSIRFYMSLSSVLLWLVPASLIKQKEEFDRLGRDRVRKLMLSSVDEEADDDDNDDVESKERYDRASPSNILSHLKSNNHGGIMTMAEIEANLHLIIIAGSETVATMLSGTINYLCQNANMLKTLAEEVRSVVHHKTDLTLATLSKLPYLTAVLKEGLRIVSPGPISFPRVVPAGGAFIAGFWVPGSTIVAVNSFAACSSAANFYNPAEFLPERWLEPAASSSLSSSSSPFISDKRDVSKHFGAGDRDCMGQGVAWAQMRLILAGLVWAFEIEAVRELDWVQQKTNLVWQKEPFEVRLRSRVQVQG